MFKEICKDFEFQVEVSGFDSIRNGESDDFCGHGNSVRLINSID